MEEKMEEEKPPKPIIHCEQCSYETTAQRNLRRHIASHHTPYEELFWYRCDQCDYKVRRKKYLDRHVRNHHSLDPWYYCNFCKFRAKEEELMKAHCLRRHDTTNWIKCDQCRFRARTECQLARHVKFWHSPRVQKLWSCEHCSYYTKRKWKYDVHVRNVHTNADQVKWYTCDRCWYMSKNKAALEEHVDTFFHCDQCKYGTRKLVALGVHIDSCHTKKERLCKDCSFVAVNKEEFKKHKLRHTETDWFYCELCVYRSKRERTLKSHMEYLHDSPETNMPLLVCEQCPTFKTRRKQIYDDHMEMKHTPSSEIKWYNCEQCAIRVRGKKNMQKHMHKVHKVDDEPKKNRKKKSSKRKIGASCA